MKLLKKIPVGVWLLGLLSFSIKAIICIVFFILIQGCNVEKKIPVYRHLLIDEGYLLVNYENKTLEKLKVKRICKKLDIDKNMVIELYDHTRVWTFNYKPHFITRYKSYIPITLDQLNKTKENVFGREVNVLSDKERQMYKPQIK